MKYKFGKTIIVALGGSVIYPEEIDVLFLKHFRKFILERLQKGSRFVVVAGGGRIARAYQKAAHRVFKINDEDKDWLGIHATRLNAHLLRTIFREVADPVVIDSHHKSRKLRYKVAIASGWRPGWSTDYIAVALAVSLKISEVIVAGKPAHVYDKDPHKNDGAKELPELTWKEYRRLIPVKWKPGLHSPVDPVAAKLAEQRKIKAIIISGKDLKNLSNLLDGKEFRGTIIS